MDASRRAAVVAFGAPCFALLVGYSSVAQAQAVHDAAAAGSAFERGREAMKRGEIEVACELFAESVQIDPARGALLNLAECDAKRGRVASALQEFRDALAALPAGDARLEFTKERIRALAPRAPTLVVRLAPAVPAGAVVLRDGVPLSMRSLGASVPLDPGAHEVRVRAAGRVDSIRSVTLAEGQAAELVVDAGAPEAASGPPPPPPPAESAPASSRTLGWVLGGSGVAALAAGTVIGVLTLDRASTVKAHCLPGCDDEGYSAGQQGKWMSIASPIALGIGAVLLGVATYLLVSDTRREPAASARR